MSVVKDLNESKICEPVFLSLTLSLCLLTCVGRVCISQTQPEGDATCSFARNDKNYVTVKQKEKKVKEITSKREREKE